MGFSEKAHRTTILVLGIPKKKNLIPKGCVRSLHQSATTGRHFLSPNSDAAICISTPRGEEVSSSSLLLSEVAWWSSVTICCDSGLLLGVHQMQNKDVDSWSLIRLYIASRLVMGSICTRALHLGHKLSMEIVTPFVLKYLRSID